MEIKRLANFFAQRQQYACVFKKLPFYIFLLLLIQILMFRKQINLGILKERFHLKIREFIFRLDTKICPMS